LGCSTVVRIFLTNHSRKGEVAIIALLMSILMPALSKVRKQARAVMCQSNLKQLGSAAWMYAGDYDGYLPAEQQGTFNTSQDCWVTAMRPYYKDGDVRLCPMASKPMSEERPEYYGGDTFLAWGIFPGNWWWLTDGGDYGSYGGVFPEKVFAPSIYWFQFAVIVSSAGCNGNFPPD